MKLFAFVLAGLSISSPAFAAECELSRSPFILTQGLPSSLTCTFDQDGNGLDDLVERELAQCVVPRLIFDSEENALASGEPRVVFNAFHVGPFQIRIRYAFLFAEDGGPATSGGFCLLDTHDGDAQGLIVSVDVDKGLTWTATPHPIDIDGVLTGFSGTHPVVYPSAGKHHWYAAPGDYEYGADCDDRANAAGAAITAGIDGGSLSHAPAMRPSGYLMCPYGECSPTPPQPITPQMGNGAWANACTFARTGTLVATTGFQPNDLSNLGFGGEHLTDWWFYDPDVTGVSFILGDNVADADGDGFGNAYTAATFDGPITLPTDLCPTIVAPPGGHGDDDSDGIGDECDPEPIYRNRYVAGGNSSFPAYAPSSWHMPWSNSQTSFGGPRHGYQDSDQDGYVDGEDPCPASAYAWDALGSANLNRWGERENRAENTAQAAAYEKLGRFDRGDRCDSYPATSMSWNAGTDEPTFSSGSSCSLKHSASYGSGEIPVEYTVALGVSENDPQKDLANPNYSPANYRMQIYRCACVGFEGSACLDNPASDCYRGNLSPAPLNAPVGRGWRPIHRTGCTTGAGGWCQPFTVAVTPLVKLNGYVSWNWNEERTLYPAHFAAGDFDIHTSVSVVPGDGQTYAASTHRYAIWTQIEEGLGFSAPPGPLPYGTGSHSGLYQDPEAYDAELTDHTSTRSRRLRASFGMPQSLAEPHTESWIGGHLCPFLPLIKWLEKLWLIDPPPFESVRGPDLRFLVGPDQAFSNLWLVRPLEGSASQIQMISGSAGSWISGSQGFGAMFQGGGSEPQLLWMEKGVRESRWALLMPAATGVNTIMYAVIDEGVIPGAAASLVQDQLGRTAAVVDLSSGTARLFDPVRGDFSVNTISLAGVAGRTGAAIALAGTQLYVAGGATSRGLATDVWSFDLLTGAARMNTAALPQRTGARLSLSEDQRTLRLVGGRDAGGAMHDGIYEISIRSPGLVSTARSIAGDTSLASSFVPARSELMNTRAGAPLRVVTMEHTASGELTVTTR
jgi:hypothetical protein